MLNDYFKKTEDYLDWDNYIRHCQMLDGFSDEERLLAQQSFRFLEGELGHEFLQKAFNRTHPFLHQLINTAPYTRKWVIRFAESLRLLKRQKSYLDLIARLKRGEEFDKALAEIEIAAEFEQVGFQITTQYRVHQGSTPDIRLVNESTDETLLVEVSVLGKSNADKNSENTFNQIMRLQFTSFQPVAFSGEVLRTLNDSELQDVLERIKTLMKEVGSNGFRELFIENTIDFAIASGDCLDRLEPWRKSRGFTLAGAWGPPSDSDEIQRLIESKVYSKQGQLPKDRPGIIVVKTTHTMLLYVYPIDYLAYRIQQSLVRYPHLFGVAVYGRYGGGSKNRSSAKNRAYYAERVKDDIINEEWVFVRNPAFNKSISEGTVRLIFKALLDYDLPPTPECID